MPKTAPYGTWASPLRAADVAAAGRRIGDLVADGSDLYWGETRPEEGGRVTIMRLGPDGAITELIPAPYNARTRVHEYGGGAITVADGVVYFSNFSDQRLYRLIAGAAPVAVTPAGPWRYADGIIDRLRNRMICVREDHSASDHEPKNEIVSIDLATGDVRALATGADFYASPRLSPDGSKLCWLAWNHPDMPWDATTLTVADVTGDGMLGAQRVVAGAAEVSIYGPLWSPSGELHFISDSSGWWNLYKLDRLGATIALWAKEEDFGLPLWTFGTATYGFHDRDIICQFGSAGSRTLARIPASGSAAMEIALPYSELGTIRIANGRAYMTAAGPTAPSELIAVDLTRDIHSVCHRPSAAGLAAAYISSPETITFSFDDAIAHAFYYPPLNPDFVAPSGEKPPLMVISHGGPTGSTSTAYSPGIQYWTTRGFAVLDINYRGSNGYGRSYRDALRDRWGIADVEDCENGARFLANRGDVDENRMVIRGGSAGGYTTLCALTFGSAFGAGASHYGIGDLEALAKETHKFEARYLDRLIGPYPGRRDIYLARSPIHHVDRLQRPMIFFQGLDDKVVPPAQAETMVTALKTKGIPVAYVPFEGEGHGFRRAESIIRALEAELYFYGRVLGFTPADAIEPVAIENLTG